MHVYSIQTEISMFVLTVHDCNPTVYIIVTLITALIRGVVIIFPKCY